MTDMATKFMEQQRDELREQVEQARSIAVRLEGECALLEQERDAALLRAEIAEDRAAGAERDLIEQIDHAGGLVDEISTMQEALGSAIRVIATAKGRAK